MYQINTQQVINGLVQMMSVMMFGSVTMGVVRPVMLQMLREPGEPMYIVSKPPKRPYLYHHSTYSGLKQIAESWAIRAPTGKHVVSLTTDPGRFLSPLPILAVVTVDGVVKIPLTEELRELVIPALYITRDKEFARKARELDYKVFTKEELPAEYKYITRFISHNQMFVGENEYAVLADHLNIPTSSVIYIAPPKLKRFKAGLSRFAMEDIRSLEELGIEVEQERR